MKKFLELSKMPLIVAVTAAVIYCLDALIAPQISEGATFLWVAFVAWTVSSSMNLKDMAKMLIGVVIGYLFAVGMMFFGKLFDTQVVGISIAGLIGIFVANFLVMYFDNFKKVWLNSITGIFTGIALTFSGLGVSMAPNSFGEAGILLGTILLYVVIGMFCAFITSFLYSKWKKKVDFVAIKENVEKTEKNDKTLKKEKENVEKTTKIEE